MFLPITKEEMNKQDAIASGAECMFIEKYPDIVSVEQLMQMLNIGQVLAYKLVKCGDIKSRKVGREYKIPKINVINYVLSGR